MLDFGVSGNIKKVSHGPVVTLNEFEPAAGVKVSKIINLSDDIARNTSSESARIATIPGSNTVGIELPNSSRENVYLSEILDKADFKKREIKLPIALGKNISGTPIVGDLASMPHLLIAGTTGSGKSVCINTIILSLLYRHTPERCKFILIDPKMLELSTYEGIPHLLCPVITEAKKAFERDEVPVGAIIVYENSIIAKAHNQREMLLDPTAHAEMIAITQASAYLQNWRLSDTTVYITLEPCTMCAGALVQARVKNLVYGAKDEKYGACESTVNLVNDPRFNHRMNVISGVLEDECSLLLKQFFLEKRRDD